MSVCGTQCSESESCVVLFLWPALAVVGQSLQNQVRLSILSSFVARMQATGLYDESYYATSYGRLRYERSAPCLNRFGQIAESLIRALHPARVFDAGCALGFLVEAFWDRGIYSEGVDISEYAIGQVREDMARYCRVQSLIEPIKGQFDLVTCIDVLEHIDPTDTRSVIANLCHAADAVLFSSSPSGFSEPRHVNVQPPKFWLDLFAEHGFGPDISFDASFVSPHTFLVKKGLNSEQSILRLFAQHLHLKGLVPSSIAANGSEQSFEVQVLPFGESGYSPQTYIAKAIAPNSWQSVSLSLPASGAMPLRVDPGHQVSVIQIRSVTAFDELSGTVLWSPSESQDFDALQVAGTAIRLDSTETGITVLSYGSDPQIIFPDFPVSGVETLTLALTLYVDTQADTVSDQLVALLKRQTTAIGELREQQRRLIAEYERGAQPLRVNGGLPISAMEVETKNQLDLEQARCRQVQDLEHQLAQSLIELKQLRTTCENMSHEIKVKKEALVQTRDQLRSLSDKAAQDRHELVITRRRMTELEPQIEKLTQGQLETADLRQQVLALRGTLDNVLASVSWRVTKPARDFMFALRGRPRQSK